MLAEDDVLMRMSLAEFLRGCGYRVLEARSAEEAIALIEADTFTPEVVVSNVELAGDGFGIANWIRNNAPHLTLILTGTPKRAANVATSLCENGPLPPPYDPQLLHRRLLRLIASRKSLGGDRKRNALQAGMKPDAPATGAMFRG
ncbi:response regulator [Bradyrhizobium sp. UFLA05-112]